MSEANHPRRVLQVFSSLDRGGAEQVVMNWYREIDRERVQFDFVVEERCEEYAHESEIRSLGGRIYRVQRPISNVFGYIRQWNRLLESHPEWTVVHAHHTSPAFIFLTLARMKGRRTIAHSHTAGGRSTAKDVLKRFARWPLRYIASDRMACSPDAARWMFGQKQVQIVPNGIDVESFRFSSDRSQILRAQHELGDGIVIGHVGNFRVVKNHRRILDVFKEVTSRAADARLVLVGDGGLRREMEIYAEGLGIYDSVRFLGVRSDIAELLGMFDVMVFPSLYEGFGVSVVEAQAAGLPVVMSDTVPKNVVVSRHVRSLSLNASNAVWAEALLADARSIESRAEQCDLVKNSEFNIVHSLGEVERTYRGER